MNLTNTSNINILLAVWLSHDDYDYILDEKYISATTLLKPLRQIILGRRLPPEGETIDISDRISARLGQSLHKGIEEAWTSGNLADKLKNLGYAEDTARAVVVNPESPPPSDLISVYLEKRSFKGILSYVIGGKFDAVVEGQLMDVKTTSVYSYILGKKDKNYSLQGSVYRWLNPEIITNDKTQINFIFTDWQKSMAKADPKYPQLRVLTHEVNLMSIEDTEKWIINKLNLISKYMGADESEIPHCTDEELWRSEPVYKYFSVATNVRATKNFDSLLEANKYLAEKGKGIVKTVMGEPKACGYCNVYNICKQKDLYFDTGSSNSSA